ncbi:MAG: DUF4394 domain-containing protein [Pedobacter sp.]|nr:MAG: DUF4394 domain-containing protein [Pedobacter sp.]
MKKFTHSPALIGKYLFAFMFTFAVISCKKEKTVITLPLVGPDVEFYVLSNNTIKLFNGKNVKTQISSVAITGLTGTEKILSVDFRPATGELYGVSDASKLYIINVTSGAARAVSTTAFTPAIAGTAVSLNFNPTVDRIRLVSNTGQNLRLNPETGLVAATDGSINGATGAVISGVAYTNSEAGATSTVLFDIDLTTKKLYKQDPPNNGTLVEVGNLMAELGTSVSFDISPKNTNAIATGFIGGIYKLFTIDVSTGKATLAGEFASGLTIQGIAISSNAAAYATTSTNDLLIFNPKNTTAPIVKAITGLQTGETIVGMDFRPVNGQIFALGSTSRLYTVNIGTGLFTQVGSGTLSTLLLGTSFGFDFNPTVDKIRVVSNTGQNLRINTDGSVFMVDGILAPNTPSVSAAAYTSNFAGATSTKLYVIDHNTDKLYTQDANVGTLAEVGTLGINVESTSGFDIVSSGVTDTAYAILTVGAATKLYTINLTTGAATAGREIPNAVTSFTLGLRL